MGFKDNFGNPQGFIGSLMLVGMNKGHTPMAKWAFTQFQVPDKGKIADVGCGGGFNVKRLLERSTSANVYGVDISDTCIKKSKKVNKSELGKRCEIYKGSAQNLPFDDNSLDLITAFETVYFWNDLEKCFSEVKRVLKDGGRFVVVNDPGDPKKHWDEMIPDMTSWKPEELETYMKNTGFFNIESRKDKFKFCVMGTKKTNIE